MAPWLIFGAGGQGTGRHCARLALTTGRPVVALVRNPDAAQSLEKQGACVIIGDARDNEAVMQACKLAGPDTTLISTLGGTQEYQAHRTIIDGAEHAGIRRMVLVTSLGCGNSWPFLSPRSRAAFGQAVREKSLAESWLQTSSLDFTILRPGGLLHGPATGNARLSQDEEVHGLVMREDVALHALMLAEKESLNGHIYSLVEPRLTPR